MPVTPLLPAFSAGLALIAIDKVVRIPAPTDLAAVSSGGAIDTRAPVSNLPYYVQPQSREPVMQPDSRIEDILHTLSDPVDFVRGIVGSFTGEAFSRSQAITRIGISGKGLAPHYCIEQGRVIHKVAGSEIISYERRAIFHGRTHNPILEDQFKGWSWSSAAMTLDEVQALLGKLRMSTKTH